MNDKDQPLAVELLGQTLSITIGVSALKDALLALTKEVQVRDGTYSVPDEYALACHTVIKLREQGRDGSQLALAMLTNIACQTAALVIKRD